MTNKKEMTAPYVSVGADTEQSFQKCSNDIITENAENINSLEEMQRELRKMLDPSYLKTMSMTELYDTVFQSRPPLIDGLLYPGTYLFVGAPKLGKSFLMAQLAYHISTGTQLWNYTVRKGTVLYLALEDDYRRLQERLYRMFGTDGAENLFFSVSAGQLGNGLDEQLTRFMQEHPDTKLIIIDTLQKVPSRSGALYSVRAGGLFSLTKTGQEKITSGSSCRCGAADRRCTAGSARPESADGRSPRNPRSSGCGCCSSSSGELSFPGWRPR